MTKDLVPFQFETETVNVTVDEKGNPWWVAKEVCEVLGLRNVTMALIEVDAQDKRTVSGTDVGRDISKLRVINESGLYDLIFKSRKPEALRFKRWVTHEVLPSIRKTGGYLHTTPEMTEEEIMDRAVLLSKKKIEARRTQREELAPKADSWSESN